MIYVADRSGGRVVVYNTSGTMVGNLVTGLDMPRGVAVLPDGNIVVSSYDAGQVVLSIYSPDGTLVRTLRDTNSFDASDLATDSNGNIYTANATSQAVMRINSVTGEVTQTYGEGEVIGATGIAVAEDGKVFVTSMFANVVRVYSPDDQVLADFRGYGLGDGQFYLPMGVAFGPNESLYVSEGSGRIQRFAALGNYTNVVTDIVSPELGGMVRDDSQVTVVIEGARYDAVNNGNGTWTLPVGELNGLQRDATYDVRVEFAPNTGVDRVIDAKSGLIITPQASGEPANPETPPAGGGTSSATAEVSPLAETGVNVLLFALAATLLTIAGGVLLRRARQ